MHRSIFGSSTGILGAMLLVIIHTFCIGVEGFRSWATFYVVE